MTTCVDLDGTNLQLGFHHRGQKKFQLDSYKLFRLTFGHVFPEKVPSRASKGKKRSIEVIVGENTILVDGIYYSCPDNKKLIELLVARWNRAPLVD